MVWENIPAVLFLSKAKLMPPYMACKWDVHGGDSCVLLQIVGSLEISKPRRFTLFQHIVLRCPRKISTTVSRNILTHFVVSSLRKGFLGTLSFWGIPQNAPNHQALAAAAGCFQSTNLHGSQHLVLV